MVIAVIATASVFWALAVAVAVWHRVTRRRERAWRLEAGMARGRHRAGDPPGPRKTAGPARP